MAFPILIFALLGELTWIYFVLTRVQPKYFKS